MGVSGRGRAAAPAAVPDRDEWGHGQGEVAINLIVQHIQDILNGDICKWQRGAMNGHGRSSKRPFPEQADSGPLLGPGKRSHLESSSHPH
ncbi:hypothetical protein lerEdw1_015845 [Lerista edwardsae]|nr:hypothetical protein lerEdw1_015845 [Lerista edwardsae]